MVLLLDRPAARLTQRKREFALFRANGYKGIGDDLSKSRSIGRR